MPFVDISTAGRYGDAVLMDRDATIMKELAMRMWIISSAVVLGLGVVGITMGQQADGEGSRTERAKQRSQLAKLRAEVELMELDHQVDADILKDLTKDVKNMDSKANLKIPFADQLKVLKEQMPEQAAGLDGKAAEEALNKMSLVDDMTSKLARPVLDRLRKEFVRETAELNEKRLELADAEKNYEAKLR